MIQFSHDPNAGTLYCYFAELEAGQVAYSLEYPASLLLDSHGAIIGLRFDLDDEVSLADLDTILQDERCRLDMGTGYLYVTITDDDAAETVALAEPALLDTDAEGVILGADLAVPAEYRTTERLARLAALLVELEDEEPLAGEGPHVFAPPPAEDDEEAEETPPAAVVSPPVSMRVGFVALVGRPNVGKSTLLNRLLGQKVAIVSPHPQTTRIPLRGILNRSDAQIIFVDTPGIHEPRHRLGQFMVELAQRTIPNADVICFMVDINKPPSRMDERIANQLRRARAPRLLVLNKVDERPRQTRGGVVQNYLEDYRGLGPWDTELAISARTGDGIATMLEEIVQRLPQGQQLYPADQVADQSEQQLAAELVREKVLRFTNQEVPHSVAVEVEEWEHKEHATYIRMSINVERDGQKGILIGAGGSMLKRIGSAAREDIQAMLQRTVYLDLWVKVRPDWRDDPNALGWLGYRLKDWQ
ncbi:MAG: GTPase Era [Chloroflexaceae bacterium]|jgi:GTP-binding protein Era|nr:GTPase Era [Chloroflexaceae bacterium]